MALTKNDIVGQIQSELGVLRNKSIEITESLIEAIKACLASGDDVLVSSFGKFCIKDKKERKGRNPATGEDAILPARRVGTSSAPASCGTGTTGADMSGRSVGFRKLEALIQHFPIDVAKVTVTPNYNVAPTQEVLAIVHHDDQNHLEKFHWGLVPFWAKDTAIGSRMINARSETVATKPSFRTPFKSRRCLILADGFFEWQGKAGNKQPMFLTLPDGTPFAFASLWETWDNQGQEASPYRSCTILTRESSESVMPIPNRMPVILKPEAFGPWLSREKQDVRLLQSILRDQVHTELSSFAVSKQINSVKVNRPGNIRPVDTHPEG